VGPRPSGGRHGGSEHRGDVLGVVLAAEHGRLRPTFVPGFLKDRRDLGVGDKFCQPDSSQSKSILIGISKDGRALGAVLLSLLSAFRCEDFTNSVEILDLRRCQDHLFPPMWKVIALLRHARAVRACAS
jgi:hypothetical protein